MGHFALVALQHGFVVLQVKLVILHLPLKGKLLVSLLVVIGLNLVLNLELQIQPLRLQLADTLRLLHPLVAGLGEGGRLVADLAFYIGKEFLPAFKLGLQLLPILAFGHHPLAFLDAGWYGLDFGLDGAFLGGNLAFVFLHRLTRQLTQQTLEIIVPEGDFLIAHISGHTHQHCTLDIGLL